MPPASTPNPPAPALLAENFWFSIVLSVSTEIECSVLCEHDWNEDEDFIDFLEMSMIEK
ncbi:hypothetical protein SLEP1_g39176 [Rubroshorea leprosula]|uniref:Uncharacterized protein n=1 Tax=Rubroshorea leprosula TaxID=152421 RepID=A0AAV5L006_9ROSI|nr:hypothetical protein SLEP1_g39176 [Rubroshorea leprosula]